MSPTRDETDSFVQGVEVWVPDGSLLQCQSSAFLADSGIAQGELESTLKKGQGLPGLAWSTGRAEVWQRLDAPAASMPRRLDAAVALPCYRGSEISAVVTFLCGSRERAGGCVEVWEPDEEGRLAHVDGTYGRLASFAELSRAMMFAKGEGLPGLTWERRRPQIIADLASSGAFLRRAAAREAGIGSGLGLPILRGGSVAEVVLLLSAHATPLARAFEIWTPDDQGMLVLEQSCYAPGLESFAALSRTTRFAAGEGLPGRVFATGRPFALDTTRADLFARHAGARATDLQLGLGLPIHDGTQVRSVVVLLS